MNLLLINGFSTPTSVIDEILSGSASKSYVYLSYPLSVLTLAGWCRKELPDINIKIIDASMDLHKYMSTKETTEAGTCLPLTTRRQNFIKSLLNKIDFIPDVIGVSINFSNGHRSCLELCQCCKEKWSESKIIVGGVHATTFTHRIIENDYIDYVLKGVGDISFINFLQQFIEGNHPNIKTIQGMPMDSLDGIPPYPYDLIDMEYIIKNESTNPMQGPNTRTGIVLMSRGCPYGCIFCSADKVHGRKNILKNIDMVITEIEYLVNNFNINTIGIIDDLFGMNKEYFYDFFDKIKEKKLQLKFYIPGGLSINVFDEKMIDVLIEHGFNAVYFPLESGSAYVQNKIIKKRVNLDKAIRLISYAKQKGIFVGINIILGFPGETIELMQETYDFVKNLPIDWVSFFSAYPYPETEMTNILLGNGSITEDELINMWDTSTQGFNERCFDTKEISSKDLSTLIYDFNIELNFFNNYNIRTKNFHKMIPKLNRVIQRYPFHVVALACRSKCYHHMGHKEQSLKDIFTINELINNNEESINMFRRYKQRIESEFLC